ncbi:MAG: Uma2 family endonuclease [Verrucomicrobia bacterium]|nr:Uma2 family endonuclease [Verrucomicrobiota bacterium]
MSSILELPTVRQRVARISVDTYHTMSELGLVDERTELLRGAIVEKMTKSPLHVTIVSRLYELASRAVRPGQAARKEDPMTLADSEPEPDIAVVVGKPDDFRSAHPRTALLVIEVAVRTEETDREKAAIYAEAGVGEYWLVLAETGVIEIFAQPEKGKFGETRVVRRGDVAVSHALPELRVDVSQLFG